MEVKEYNQGDDYIVEIKCSSKAGDMAHIITRNKNSQDVPVVMVYNMGTDFNMRTFEDQKRRVMNTLKYIHIVTTEVVAKVGGMIGAKLRGHVPPHELGEG